MPIFTGCGVAMVTPFGADGSIDYNILDRYIDHLISGGVAALLPFGTTGEPSTVLPEEYETAIKFIVKKVAGRLPVIAGAGSNSTKAAAEKAAKAQKLGVDGVLVVTPYYNKCTQRGIVEHYKAVAAATDLPVIAYNVPTRTCVNILPETVIELAKIKNVVAIKEASGDIDQFQEVAKVCSEIGFDLYCGDDSLTTIAMALGALGTISVAANPAPSQMSILCALCSQGKFSEARELQFKLSDFIHSLFCEVNPIPVKKAMQFLGIDVGSPRLPLTELEEAHAKSLQTAMRGVGLI